MEHKAMLERRIKKTKVYLTNAKRFINLCDNKGKTALHYAVFKGNLQIVNILLFKYKGLTLIRDHKQRVSIIIIIYFV